MQKQMTISVSEDVYNTLASLAQRQELDDYIAQLVNSRNAELDKPHIVKNLTTRRKYNLTPDEACNKLCGMFEGSKFTVDKFLEERHEETRNEEEEHNRLFRKVK